MQVYLYNAIIKFMSKPTFTSYFIGFIILGAPAVSAWASETEIAPGSGTVVKETSRTLENGSYEKETRSGKIKNRNGLPRVGEIYDEDKEKIRNRIYSLQLWSFSFGPGYGRHMANENPFYTMSLGKHWEVSENAELRALGHLYMASKGLGYLLGISMGGSYFFSTGSLSPLVGADLGIATANSDLGVSTQFSGVLHGGLRFFRTSTTQMQLIGFYQTIFDNKNPAVYGLQLGLLFQ